MRNIGQVDRGFRAIAGVALVALAFLLPGQWPALAAWWWLPAVVGVILAVTATFRFCPLYRLFGVRTCPLS